MWDRKKHEGCAWAKETKQSLPISEYGVCLECRVSGVRRLQKKVGRDQSLLIQKKEGLLCLKIKNKKKEQKNRACECFGFTGQKKRKGCLPGYKATG